MCKLCQNEGARGFDLVGAIRPIGQKKIANNNLDERVA